MMKTRWMLFVTVASLAMHGCLSSVGFDLERPIDEQRQPGDPIAHAAAMVVPGQSPVNPFTLSVDLSSEAQARGVGPVRSVSLKTLSFTVTPTARESETDQDCWDFVESVEVRVESTREGTSLAPQTIATAMNPGCVETLDFQPVAGVNLKPYIEEGVRIVTTASGIPPADDVTFNGRIVLRVDPF